MLNAKQRQIMTDLVQCICSVTNFAAAGLYMQ